MEAKVGDRVSFAAKKVGQVARAGVVRSVTKGLSGVRYQVRWDDGSETVIAPGAGTVVVNGKAKVKKARGAKKANTKKATAKKTTAKKAAVKKAPKRKRR